MSDTALVVMARYPEPGKTKTRLARSLGAEQTALLYQSFLTDLALRFADPANLHSLLHWAYTPAEVDYARFVATLAPALASRMRCFPQQGADLGARLLQAFQWSHQQGFAYTVLIGSDSPHIPLETVRQARLALDEVDVVLGPAEDGGYYLIALRQPHDLFSSIPMSTEAVLRQTLARAQTLGLTTRLLDPLFDVDELSELRRLAVLLRADSSLAPITAAHLATITQKEFA